MNKLRVVYKKRIILIGTIITFIFLYLIIRIGYLQLFQAVFLEEKAYKQQTRDRDIPAKRGKILDRNSDILAESISVNTVYVINAQIEKTEEVAKMLSEKLNMDYDGMLKKVTKRTSIQKIKGKVDKKIADEIRNHGFKGVIVDEAYIRHYPYKNFASQVIGFCGGDNQGILGLEVKYDNFIKGITGKILLPTDVSGNKIEKIPEVRLEPLQGDNLVTSLDSAIQHYSEQALEKVLEEKKAKRVSILVMNPQNGEIYAMASKPDFDLNKPFEVTDPRYIGIWGHMQQKEQMDILNGLWRNFSINDTYEPGSVFKMIVAASALNEKIVDIDTRFHCSGAKIVGDRKIKCWYYPRSHGSETFLDGVKNSCNVVFMETGAKLGVDKFYEYFYNFGFKEKTGIDLPGEASGIIHNIKNVGPVELAVMSFGQSFQITPIELARACSAIVNGGYLVNPHFAVRIESDEGTVKREFKYTRGRQVISEETSSKMRYILEQVVFSGTGHNAYVEGYKIGGKTATSEKLPRRQGKYISSFLGFAPADNPKVIALVMIDEPQGVYYGGVVAAPIIKDIFSNILPYLGIEKNTAVIEGQKTLEVEVPDFRQKTVAEAKKLSNQLGLKITVQGTGKNIINQFPLPGEVINTGEEVSLEVE